MQKSRMKASEELQPIGMRVAVESENKRQCDEKNAGPENAGAMRLVRCGCVA